MAIAGSSKEKTEFIEITPATAKAWLEEHNTKNRTIKKAHVARLAADMKQGRWVGENGESIKFDVDGRLVDGQHRLAACVASKVTITSLVVRDIPADSYETIGTGARKSAGDFLGPIGYRNANMLAATARLVAMWNDGSLGEMKDGFKMPTVSRVMEVVEDNPGLVDSVHWVAGHLEVKKLLTPSFAALIHYAGTQAGLSGTVCAFLERLGNGLGLRDFEPVYHLRKFLLGNKTTRRKAGQAYILALAIKAWNLAKTEKAVGDLRFRVDEKFPQL